MPRDRLRYLVTQREARKLGRGFDPYALYKHVSGVNAVRLRRLLASLTGEDYPADAEAAIAQLRIADARERRRAARTSTSTTTSAATAR